MTTAIRQGSAGLPTREPPVSSVTPTTRRSRRWSPLRQGRRRPEPQLLPTGAAPGVRSVRPDHFRYPDPRSGWPHRTAKPMRTSDRGVHTGGMHEWPRRQREWHQDHQARTLFCTHNANRPRGTRLGHCRDDATLSFRRSASGPNARSWPRLPARSAPAPGPDAPAESGLPPPDRPCRPTGSARRRETTIQSRPE